MMVMSILEDGVGWVVVARPVYLVFIWTFVCSRMTGLHNEPVLSSSFSQVLGLVFAYSGVHCSNHE
jgi:hypothetical protein